jgi:hypothetical protein
MSTELFAGPESPQSRTISADRAFRGLGYAATLDRERLSLQIERIRLHMLRAGWQTFMEVRSALEAMYPPSIFPGNSISAHLRDLRKLGYEVQTRRRGRDRAARCAGIWEYRLVLPEESAAG